MGKMGLEMNNIFSWKTLMYKIACLEQMLDCGGLSCAPPSNHGFFNRFKIQGWFFCGQHKVMIRQRQDMIQYGAGKILNIRFDLFYAGVGKRLSWMTHGDNRDGESQ